MKSQKDYWDYHIADWEKSAYERRSSGSLIEKVATIFRGHLIHRKNTCRRMLAEQVEDKKILEIGCGTGALLREVTREGRPRYAVGWEISEEAARIGQELLANEGLENMCRIECRDIEYSLEQIPLFDFVYGLGILEYLQRETLYRLFEQLKDCAFFFQYHRKYLSMKNVLHVVYRSVKRIPIYNQYTRKEILKICTNAGVPDADVRFFDEMGNSFICRMPHTMIMNSARSERI